MRPTEVLSQEHRVIEQVLDCLEQMAHRCHRDGVLDTADAATVIDFLRGFADRCHHGKEESHLFPAMEAKGFPRNGGPTGVMLYEHDEGRRFVSGMAAAIETAGTSSVARTQFADNARQYIALLREHIRKEDQCLFTMANQVLSEADQQQLLDAFHTVEAEHMGEGTHEKFVRLANQLAERYGVARATASPACGGCGCSHE